MTFVEVALAVTVVAAVVVVAVAVAVVAGVIGWLVGLVALLAAGCVRAEEGDVSSFLLSDFEVVVVLVEGNSTEVIALVSKLVVADILFT